MKHKPQNHSSIKLLHFIELQLHVNKNFNGRIFGSASEPQVHRISWPLHGEDQLPTGNDHTGQEYHGSLSWKPHPRLKNKNSNESFNDNISLIRKPTSKRGLQKGPQLLRPELN